MTPSPSSCAWASEARVSGTRLSESGRTVSTSSACGAPVTAYSADSPTGRLLLGLPTTSMACDGIFGVGDPVRLLVLVELKGKDAAHAFEQILVTDRALQKKCPDTKRLGVIVTARSMPAASKEWRQLIDRASKQKIRVLQRSRERVNLDAEISDELASL